MTLETELSRFSALDLGKTKETLSATRESINAVTGGLNSIGGIDERIAGAVQTASGALQIMTSLATVGKLAKTVTEARTTAKTIESGALTAACMAMGPTGWARIGLAAATMGTASAVMYATVNTVRLGRFDLSTASGQDQAVRKATEAMA